MRAALHDAACIHHKDLVRLDDGGQAMRDDQHGLALRGGAQLRYQMVTQKPLFAGDDVTVFLDGAQLDGAAAYVVDAGRQRSYRQWMSARDAAIDRSSPAAGALLRKFYDHPPASGEIAGAPAGRPGEQR